MNTVAQLVVAAILNFLGMAPDAPEKATPVKAEIVMEKEHSARLLAGDGKICDYSIFINVDAIN